ncbi:hypothetical protein JQ599_11285 [Bradyrhizobium diazoefficiens]|uniref:hypothetical protein n=1 Tax=unclassified Bradyrhizobium TaxID=2631580 RepID=UPI0018886D14|nr:MULTISPECIES: hypothetical protein [Bradyrhizobium]MBR0700480.1 hypothetical protein [Bradyrhizobium diazoefficiens]MBR0768905.1 hypothetical protein [Bradyrhizobium diazoefficiens]MBR0931213.1 hypothetical protein [Bradyrhizobium diazoefficiens]MDT4742169.1 hypothetical protein [Bradyrhizobium sp. WYCCWR 12699]QOZ76800.1 hypothetical protein XH83_15870 [Bradyrhizobium sp. CCBAU 53351]
MRDLSSQAMQGSGAVKKWGFIAMHAAVAAAFIFLLQRFSLNASLESSLLWALTFAVCAAGLAYKQTIR